MDLWITSLVVWGSFVLLGMLIRFIFASSLTRWVARFAPRFDDVFRECVKKYAVAIFFWIGVLAASKVWPLDPASRVVLLGERAILAILIFYCAKAFADFVSRCLHVYAQEHSLPFSSMSLTDNLIHILIFILAILLLLSNLGISIAPILTALGVGSLAVALALQDTLSDLFSGIYILANRQIGVGDYVKLESGQEGVIDDIGWKVSRLKEISNNVILVPNSRFAKSIVTKYFVPENRRPVVVPVKVSYDSDLAKVENVAIEIAGQLQKEVTAAVKTFTPIVRYSNFGESGIGFNVIMQVEGFTDTSAMVHEFMKRLQERFGQEKIAFLAPPKLNLIAGSENKK